jgi:hypothetical protein
MSQHGLDHIVSSVKQVSVTAPQCGRIATAHKDLFAAVVHEEQAIKKLHSSPTGKKGGKDYFKATIAAVSSKLEVKVTRLASIIAGISALSALNQRQRIEVAKMMTEESFPKDACILNCRTGLKSALFIITSGTVLIKEIALSIADSEDSGTSDAESDEVEQNTGTLGQEKHFGGESLIMDHKSPKRYVAATHVMCVHTSFMHDFRLPRFIIVATR